MKGYIHRDSLHKKLEEMLENFPAVAILGARQVGKSTLAKHTLKSLKNTIYLDLQLPKDMNQLSDPEAFFEFNRENLICLTNPIFLISCEGLLTKEKETVNF